MESPSASVLRDLDMLQRMVDISITTLEGLRRESSSGSDLIQQEIKTVEVCIASGTIYLGHTLRFFYLTLVISCRGKAAQWLLVRMLSALSDCYLHKAN